jgi:two-component system sensor histidine kinase BaeS
MMGMKPRIKSLFAKILLAQVTAVVLALAVVTLITRSSLDRGIIDFLERQEAEVLDSLAPALGDLYTAQGGWAFLRGRPEAWRRVLRQTRPLHAGPGPRAGESERSEPGAEDLVDAGLPAERDLRRLEAHGPWPPPGHEPLRWLRSFDRLRLRDRLFLLDGERLYLAGARVTNPQGLPLEAVTAGNSTVGWIGFVPMREGLPPEAQRFLRGQVRILFVSLLVALALAALLAYFLARHLSRPVQQLDDTVRDLSHGHYERRARVASRDEIGRLGDNVNRLAQSLEQNRSARNRWMADIAHELRTPLTILKGEVEALADGVRQPDQRVLASLTEEINQLSVLVDDLQSLALADAGALSLRQETVDLGDLAQRACEAFRDRLAGRGIALELNAPDPVSASADPRRLRELLHNLLENCARYVDAGGRVRVSVRAASGAASVALLVEDSGPGVAEEQLERLFERFFRVERGRSRAGGGSGLGLAICRRIAEAHGGHIRAARSTLGGLAIHVDLPS